MTDVVLENEKRKQVLADWIADLRSGEYAQTSGTLYNGRGYCCLGVLMCTLRDKHPDVLEQTNVHVEVRSEPELSTTMFVYEGDIVDDARYATTGQLHRYLGTALGIHDRIGKYLTELNDDWRMSFPQIAIYIEENLMQEDNEDAETSMC